MKAAKAGTPNGLQPVWCERCYIRIAPSEQRTVVSGKIYHTRCYSKARTASKTK
jgi:hypothetical protein